MSLELHFYGAGSATLAYLCALGLLKVGKV